MRRGIFVTDLAISEPLEARQLLSSAPALNLLFFGNSFTYNTSDGPQYDMPSTLKSIAVADGFAAPNVYEQILLGETLADHLNKIASDGSNNIIVHSLPAGQQWSDVVMQEYSTRPTDATAPEGDVPLFRSDALQLYNDVRANSPSAKGVLYETWARGPLNSYYPTYFTGPADMQNQLQSNYNLVAGDINAADGAGSAAVSPVGEAWRGLTWEAGLYSAIAADGVQYHPSTEGELLNAMVLFDTIYHVTVTSIPLANIAGILTNLGLTDSIWTALANEALAVSGQSLTAPAAPTSAVAAAGDTQVNLSWNASATATGYNIYRGTSPGGESSAPINGIKPLTSTSYVDTTAQDGSTYYYTIEAVNSANSSGPSQEVSAQPTSTPLVQYEFDQTSAADSSGRGNNATLVGNPTFAAGESGEAINLNGSSQYASLADNPSIDPTNAITLSAWIDASDWNGNRRIIQKGNTDDQYRLTAENGVLKFDLYDVGAVTAPLPSTATGHLLTGTYDGATMKLYVDGVVVASAAHTGAITVTGDPLTVGTKNGSTAAGDYFHGLLDDVRVYGRALTAMQVAALLQKTPQNETSIFVTPSSANVTDGTTEQFAAIALDQNGQPMATQPTFTWSLTNGSPAGSVNSSGLYSAPATGSGADSVMASDTNAGISSKPAAANYAAVNLSPVLEYEFDSSSAADSSGYGNNGTLVGNPAFNAGHPGQAISLNGSNQYLTLANNSTLDPTSDITLSAWIDASDWSGNRRIIQKGNTDDQYRFTAESSVLKFDLFGIGTLTAALPSTGMWHLVTGTYDGSTMKLYLDGAVVASAAHTGALAVTSDPLDVGNKNGSSAPSDTFHGSLDDVRVYPRAISAAEVQSLMQSVSPKETSVVVTPSSSSVADGATQQFAAVALDQFGLPMATQPAFTWSLTNPTPAGSISGSGLYSAPETGTGSDTIKSTDATANISSKNVIASYAAVNLAPTVEYEFDSSSAVDSSGNGNNGTLFGNPGFTTGVSGSAISLNGSNQYVTLANNSTLDPASGITLSAWINATDWNGNRRIIQKGNTDNQYRLTAESGVLKFDLFGIGVITAALPSTKTWHLITATYDGSIMKLYVDGIVVASTAHTGAIAVTSDPLTVGTKNGSVAAGDFFHGSLDDVRVYGRAISASEIQTLSSE